MWEAAGYRGEGNVESLVGSLYNRPAIVCGSGRGVFAEAENAAWLLDGQNPVFFAVNDVGMYLPRIDHWVSLHGTRFVAWSNVRRLYNGSITPHWANHSVINVPFVDYAWNGLMPLFLLSSYFAMQIAHIMGAGLIVLCGCPGDSTPRFFEHNARTDFAYGNGFSRLDMTVKDQLVDEMERLPNLKAKVRSMSGWTHKYFGGL